MAAGSPGRAAKPDTKEEESIKVVVVGDGAVGKTSMLYSYTRQAFPEDHVPTVFDNFDMMVMVNETRRLSVGLWDTAGQDAFDHLRHLAYPGTHCFLVCYSLDNPDSLANVQAKWLPELRANSPSVPFILVGTKLDLRASASTPVATAVGEEVSRREKAAAFIECSAKTQENLKTVFDTVIRECLRYKEGLKTGTPARKGRCVLL